MLVLTAAALSLLSSRPCIAQASGVGGSGGNAAWICAPLEIGPIDGVTTAWHPAPERTGVPNGETVIFRQKVPSGAQVHWSGATPIVRNPPGMCVALCPIDRAGPRQVRCQVQLPDGSTWDSQCDLEPIDLTATPLRVCEVRVDAAPFTIDEASTNDETVDAFFGPSIADVTRLGGDHYRTAVNTKVHFTVEVEPASMAPLVESKVDGAPPKIGADFADGFDMPGAHQVDIGPPGGVRSLRFDTYRVDITTDVAAPFPLGVPIPFRAVTDPPGFEDEVRWLASTKFGGAAPKTGVGPTFAPVFTKVYGTPPGPNGGLFAWYGVKGGYATQSFDGVAPDCVPASLMGLPTFPEFPYQSGSVGPLGPVPNPQLDQNLRDLAVATWQAIDSNATDTSLYDQFQWTAPEALALDADQTGGPNTQIDPFGGGLALFRSIYDHRLALSPSGPVYDIEDLILDDIDVATYWRHYTTYRQLITTAAGDPIAHQNHQQLVTDALGGVGFHSIRGVLVNTPAMLVSDRPKDDLTQPPPSPKDLGPLPQSHKDLHACIVLESSKLAGIPCLYIADGEPFQLSWLFFKIFIDAIPGFDCDDFADAIGSYLIKNKPGASYALVYTSFDKTKSDGTKGAGAGHAITKVKLGDCYWLVDAQTGAIAGPFDKNTPMDAALVIAGYSPFPGSVYTEQKEYPCEDRSEFRKKWKDEPDFWGKSLLMKLHFQFKTGLDPACFLKP